MTKPTIAIVALLIIAACEKHLEGPPYKVGIFDTYGEFTSPSKNWRIALNRSDPGISVTKDAGELQGTSSVCPSDWVNRDGFFCLVDREDRIWAFDGSERVIVLERIKDGTRIWGPNYPGQVPSDVISKLPSKVAKQFAEQAGTGQPATRPDSDFQGSYKPQPDTEGRSR